MLRTTAQRQANNDPAAGEAREKREYISAIRALSAYIWPYRTTFFLVFACILIAVSAELLQPYLLKVVIDDHLLAGNAEFRSIWLFAAIYLGLSAADFVFTYLQNNMLQYAGQSIVAKIRKSLFSHIVSQSVSFFDRNSRGKLITFISSDTEALSQFFNQVLLTALRDGMTLIIIIVMMFQLDATVTYYCLALLPLIALIAISFRTYMRKIYQLARSQISRLVTFTAENLAGMSIIQAFYQEKEQSRRFQERNRAYFKANIREIRTNVLFNRSYDVLGNLSVAFIVWLGGKAVLRQELEFGVLYAFITYIRMFFQPISAITQQWNTLQSTTVSVNRIWGLFAVAPDVVDAAEAKTDFRPQQVKGRIDFNHVTFGYSDGAPVIKALDLHIAPGELVGIVGATGAGKSSLISLLCRFYDVQSGSIALDGTDIRDIPQAQLHRTIGLVQQEPFIYSGSVRDNIRLFDPSISDEQIVEACRLIGAEDVIQGMHHGYDTRLSENGSGLSAGERQLISFARIIVFQPKIVILDEATANLDSHTERLIQHALHIVSRERTTLVIAHRLSTVVHADRILVMQDGEVVEQGTHAQLLARRGYYEQLYRFSVAENQ